MKPYSIIYILLPLSFALSQDYTDLAALDAAIEELRISDSIAAARREADSLAPADTTDYHSDPANPGAAFVPAHHQAYSAIAVCQARIDSVRAGIAAHRRGRELLGLDVADQKRFMDHLLTHGIVDSAMVLGWACGLREMQEREIQKNEHILSVQTGNTRAVVWRHITALKKQLRDINSYVVYLQGIRK